MLKVLDHEFDVDMMDLDASGPIWERVAETEARLQAITAIKGDSPAVHEQQTEMFEMFKSDLDFVLGEGAVEKLLNGKRHFTLALKAWYEMYTGITLQYAEATREAVALQKDAMKQFSAVRIAKR